MSVSSCFHILFTGFREKYKHSTLFPNNGNPTQQPKFENGVKDTNEKSKRVLMTKKKRLPNF